MRQDDRSAAPMRPFAAAPLSRLPAEAAKAHCEGLSMVSLQAIC